MSKAVWFNSAMMRGAALLLVGPLVFSISCSGGYEPVYRPDPIVDGDPYSALARAAREHNRAVEQGADAQTLQQTGGEVRRLIGEILAYEQLEQEAAAELVWLDGLLEADPTGHVPMQPLAWVVAQVNASMRDTVYVMYGYSSGHWAPNEESKHETLELALNLRGYRMVRDTCVTGPEWYGYWLRRDGAGVIWRGHGWFGRSEAEDARSEDVVSRVLTGECGGKKQKIFADTWAEVLPEGLVFSVIATCGGAGPWEPEQVNDLDDLGDPEQLRFFTFHTELSDRTVLTRAYPGYLVTGSYQLEPLSWKAATVMLPGRAHLAPDLVSEAQVRLAQEIQAGGEALQGALRVLDDLPVTEWLPRLLSALEQADSVESAQNLKSALGHLSERLSGTAQSYDSAEQWQSWWNSDPVLTLRETAEDVERLRPAAGWVWVRFVSAFSERTGFYRAVPRVGTDRAEYCHERWLRCQFSKLGPWALNPDDTLTRTVPAFDDTGCGGPLPLALSTTYLPADRGLEHNLSEVLDTLSATQILEHCDTWE